MIRKKFEEKLSAASYHPQSLLKSSGTTENFKRMVELKISNKDNGSWIVAMVKNKYVILICKDTTFLIMIMYILNKAET